mgnify:FL=1
MKYIAYLFVYCKIYDNFVVLYSGISKFGYYI